MITYRPFRNSDPPGLAAIWCSQPPQRRLVQPMSTSLLDRHVFSKTYFDRLGLIVAVDDGRPVGFAHAGFGPTSDRRRLGTEQGVVAMVLAAPHDRAEEITGELLRRAEEYLAQRGATTLYAGAGPSSNPFYAGMYGGNALPAVLASDAARLALFRAAGYEEIGRYTVYQRLLSGFRAPVSRDQMQVRRSHQIEALLDPQVDDWWEACTYGLADRTQFLLRSRSANDRVASATFWDLEPMASSWGVHAVGLCELTVRPDLRRQGLATFMVGEALRQLQTQGVTVVEVQVDEANLPASALFAKLGFQLVDQSLILRKVADRRV